MTILRQQKGMALMEVIVASGILAILVYSIISMKASVFKMSQGVLQRGSVARVIFAIQEDLVKDMDSLPFRANAQFLTGTSLNQSQYEASFDDASAQQACYDKEGRSIPLTTSPKCEFRLSYYRVLEVDRNYQKSSGQYEPIAMSRLVMRAVFNDSASKSSRTLYLSRLKAHVLNY